MARKISITVVAKDGKAEIDIEDFLIELDDFDLIDARSMIDEYLQDSRDWDDEEFPIPDRFRELDNQSDLMKAEFLAEVFDRYTIDELRELLNK